MPGIFSFVQIYQSGRNLQNNDCIISSLSHLEAEGREPGKEVYTKNVLTYVWLSDEIRFLLVTIKYVIYLSWSVSQKPLDSSCSLQSPPWKFELVSSYHLSSGTCSFDSWMCHGVPCPLCLPQPGPHLSSYFDTEVLQWPGEWHQNWNCLWVWLPLSTCKLHQTSGPNRRTTRQLEIHRKCAVPQSQVLLWQH